MLIFNSGQFINFDLHYITAIRLAKFISNLINTTFIFYATVIQLKKLSII
jgi:hypothetical protein